MSSVLQDCHPWSLGVCQLFKSSLPGVYFLFKPPSTSLLLHIIYIYIYLSFSFLFPYLIFGVVLIGIYFLYILLFFFYFSFVHCSPLNSFSVLLRFIYFQIFIELSLVIILASCPLGIFPSFSFHFIFLIFSFLSC